MPRDTIEFDGSSEAHPTAAAAATAVETIPACYICGAWADDAKRCRHPGSNACIQASSRFAVLLQPVTARRWPMPHDNLIRH